eukprot:SAG22_NODE_685_length_7917_cov_15.152852_3_plen_105_part_00
MSLQAVDNSSIAPPTPGKPVERTGEEEDALLAANWMKGKAHPVTGALLRCEEVRLAPGSLIACLSVSKKTGTQERRAALQQIIADTVIVPITTHHQAVMAGCRY